MEEYKPNSYKSKGSDNKTERKKIKKVVTGVVKTKKKSAGKKVLENFILEDIDSVKSYVISSVVIPAVKDILYDTITSGLSMLLSGDGGGSRSGYRGRRSSSEYDSYQQYYKDKNKRSSKSRTPDRTDRYSNDDVILDSRVEAEEVLEVLNEYIDEFGMVSLLEFYESVGKTSNYTDSKYGWFDLKSASISRTRDGYLIKLPRPVLLD